MIPVPSGFDLYHLRPIMPDFLSILRSRGLFHQCSDEAGLLRHAGAGQPVRRAYVGYDPTAPSLTVGNLVTIMMLRHWQEAGGAPVVLCGGGTGLIGDPSGKSAERELQSEQTVRDNVASQQRIFSSLLDFTAGAGERRATMLNNADWLAKLGFIEVLRDVGKHFSVNQMIARDAVKNRMENGISYTEFSYMLLQAFDFLHLHRTHGVTVQMGGSDQWGNIVSGIDLIRREAVAKAGGAGAEGVQVDAFAVTAPLVTKADGGKFGKSESGAIWLTADRTSPYAYYQFWLNAADADVGRFLRIYTTLPVAEIEAIEAKQAAEPHARHAQRALAREATALLHGPSERDNAEAAAAALFSGNLGGLPVALIEQVFAGLPASTHDKALLAGEGVLAVDLVAGTSLAKSKSEARQKLTEGAVSVAGRKLGPADRLTTADLLHGTYLPLRRGKRDWHLTRWA